MSREVVITGLGMVTPAGHDAPTTWKGLLAGGQYIRPLRGIQPPGCATHFAGQVPSCFTPPRGAENLDRVCQLALAAAEEAVLDAGIGQFDAERTMVSVGTSKGGILSFAEIAPLLIPPRKNESTRLFSSLGAEGDAQRSRLTSIPPDAPARCIAKRFGITGGVHATVAACSTGTLAVIRGLRLIQDHQADMVLAGSSDASLHALWFAAFEQMGVLAPAHPDLGPGWACRPFDRQRAGFALGEGAGILVLEASETARRRGARVVARIAGAASATDPAGLTQLATDGESLAWAIQSACAEARCTAGNLGGIHAHGTATDQNDHVEARAISSGLGVAAAFIPMASIKGAIGHLLGGAGAVELGVAALACRDRRSPGNATLLEQDPRLGKLTLPHDAFAVKPSRILKTSLGFGGHVAAVVLTAD